ncbi:MAG: OB-fold domain-containing protein [Bacillota bacterium]
MAGIVSYGAYVPWYRLNRQTILWTMGWFNPAAMLPGKKAVAGCDEDSITMAVEAGVDCLQGFPREKVDALYLATTTAPYKERQNAGIAAAALDLREDLRTADFTDSLKAGTAALLSANEAVRAQGAAQVLVAAADTRLGKMGSAQEYFFGDGAAAFLLGEENVIAELKGFYSLSADFADHRRAAQDVFDRAWEERWMRDAGYLQFIPRAIAGLLKKYGLNAGDLAKVIYACPYNREHTAIARKLGLPPEKVQDNLMSEVGDTGAAYPLMMLAAALEEAQPGDKILVVSYGNGADALYFEVTEEIVNRKDRKGVRGHLADKNDLGSYEKYAVFKNLLPLEVGIRGEEIAFTQLSTLFRERRSVLGLVGVRCRKCGTPQFPVQRVCVNPECGAVDQMEPYRFSDRRGRLFTYTADRLAASLNPPAIYGIVDFEGGGRYMFDLTDCEQDALKVGMSVRMSFRRKYSDETRGIYGYFWKAVPLREVR